ncbi:MAG: hypothetical protein LBP65_02005 [Puniceicoccales bacterium]|jgi:hypothetical protein|nr:hypothetical protein [Puniceicoccales bacterium]
MGGRLRHIFELPKIPSTAINRRSNSVLLQGTSTIESVIYREIIYDGRNCPTVDQWQIVAFSGPHRRWIQKFFNGKSQPSSGR